MSWDEGQTIRARFDHSCELGRTLHGHWRLGESYGGFAQALERTSPTLVPGLVRRFQRQMRGLAGAHWLCRGWCAFAADGTRIETPHTAANEAQLGCAGKQKSAPQVYLTSLWHLGLGLPWDFRTGRGVDSERRQLEDMLAGLPERSLIVADAGFCGYETCCRILQAGCSFLLRVGSNITLLTDLGFAFEERDGLVSLWPLKFRDRPPLLLRLIVLCRGQQTIHLLTNVLDFHELSDADASGFYALRWPTAEVGYRSYKQTLDRRTLLSRTPATCLVEAQWTLLGLWLLGLLCVSRQSSPNTQQRHDEPRRWSPAKARDAVRRAVRFSTQRPGRGRSRRVSLGAALRQARHDAYVRRRSKTARNYPRKKKEKPPGPPKIKPATARQTRQAARLREKLTAAA
jgi:hypothetical protein